MYCPSCGIETGSDAQFCGSCGANLQTGEVVYGSILPRVGFVDAIRLGFNNYFNFSGRSRRSEYWYWVLFVTVVGAILATIDSSIAGNLSFEDIGILEGLFILVTLIPGLAVSVRRLHDVNRTGWWLLLILTIIGVFVLLYWACQKGTEGKNTFG